MTPYSSKLANVEQGLFWVQKLTLG